MCSFVSCVPALICVVLKTAERDAAPLFDLLRHKYALALTRDPAFTQVSKAQRMHLMLQQSQTHAALVAPW